MEFSPLTQVLIALATIFGGAVVLFVYFQSKEWLEKISDWLRRLQHHGQ